MKAPRISPVTAWLLVGTLLGFIAAVLVYWMKAVTVHGSDEQAKIEGGARTAAQYFIQIWEGGPAIFGLYGLMLLGFLLSVILAFRRPGTVGAFAAALAPFVFGALTFWVGLFGFEHVTFTTRFEGNPNESLALVRAPFHHGMALSAVAFTLFAATFPRRSVPPPDA